MSAAALLLADLYRQGMELLPDGDSVICRAPAGSLTPELRQAIRQHKRELLTLLLKDPEWDQDAGRLVAWFARVHQDFPTRHADLVNWCLMVIESGPRHPAALAGELARVLRWLFNTHSWYEDDTSHQPWWSEEIAD